MTLIQLRNAEAVFQGEYDHAKKKQEVVDRIKALSCYNGNCGRNVTSAVNNGFMKVEIDGKPYGVMGGGPAGPISTFIEGWQAAAPDRPLYFALLAVKGQYWLVFFKEDVTARAEAEFSTGVVDSVANS